MVAKTSGKAKELRVGEAIFQIDEPVAEVEDGSGIYWRVRRIMIVDLSPGIVQYELWLYRQDSEETKLEHYTASVPYVIRWEE